MTVTATSLQAVITAAPAWKIWTFLTGGLTVLYFGMAFAGIIFRRILLRRTHIGRVIDSRKLAPHQLRNEIGYSLISIFIFGGYGVLTMVLHHRFGLPIRWTFDGPRLSLDLVVFGLWNEIHFYLCHRLLHTNFLYRRIHRIHHRSVVPTPFSTYSFHPLEAALLGSVMILGMTFYTFSIGALLLAPLESLALNTLGHWNYDPFPQKPLRHLLAASRRHALHHGRVTGNFGFSLPYLDRWFKTELR